jgi:hypothetical protein
MLILNLKTAKVLGITVPLPLIPTTLAACRIARALVGLARKPPQALGEISNTWHRSGRTSARLPRGDQMTLTGGSSAMAPSSLSRRRRRPPRCAVGARSLNSNRCHVDNRRVRPAKWHVYGRHVYKLLLEVPAQRQHVRVARSTLKAFNQEQSLTAVHSWPLLDLGRRLQRLRFPCRSRAVVVAERTPGTAAVPTAPDCCPASKLL